MNFDFLLIFLVLGFLRRTLNIRELHPEWNIRFRSAMIVSIILLAASAFPVFAPYLIWVGLILLVALVYLLYKIPLFKPARNVLIAILPYIIVTIISEITKGAFLDFYNKWENIFESLHLFSILWGVGVWIVTRKQRKELAKAKEKMLEQEEKNKLMNEMKIELEKQVTERTEELTKQNDALASTLEELRSTQNQLIQSEKMASLGELTAGIAHEIQNPLNFVNNFSEVSDELIDEMKEELAKGNEALAIEIAQDIKNNLQKINFHGKRADAIVKGMLQHSRASTGIPEPTDVNDLCDEYFRLAFHGLRAKDKSFNAKMNTDFDPALNADTSGNGKVKMIPQDIGRVLLNLLTNAFYEVHKKSMKLHDNDSKYEPTVSVTTKRFDDKIQIMVADNGNGMPKEVLSKIFQPFYTTKPTGEGTGLGLSLSYDIVTKGHDGDIRVITHHGAKKLVSLNGVVLEEVEIKEENEIASATPGTTFIIELPVK